MGRAIDEKQTAPRRVAAPPSAGPATAVAPVATPPVEIDRLSEAPPSRAPTRLGRYHVLFPVARGGMGAVYAAELRGESGLSKLVAVKVLHRGGATAEGVRGFVEEARLSMAIEHPNVVSASELGMDGDEPFLVLELVRGVPLSRMLGALRRSGDRLAPELAVWIASQVAAGLAAAHERGVVHRDVSPQNVLCDWQGRVLLLDFGVAKLLEAARHTASGVVKGKFGYMAPEQLYERPIDGRTDVFALGIVLYEMLTCAPLYSELAPAAAMLRITSDELPDMSGLDPALADVVRRSLARDPAQRTASALALRDALRGWRDARAFRPDAVDLAEQLATLFPGEKERFEARLDEALHRAAAQPPVVVEAPAAVASPAPAPPPARDGAQRAVLPLVGVGALALVAGVVAATRLFAPAASSGSAGPSEQVAPAPSAPEAASSARPADSGVAAPSAHAPAASDASAAPERPAASGAPRAPAGSLTTRATPSAAPAPTATPSATGPDVKGQPFRRW